MKKKLFTLLAAAVMACCALAAPTSAAETYKMGDVNMDGSVDLADAILMLQEYTETVIIECPSILTTEQRALAKVIDAKFLGERDENHAFLRYALYTLMYTTECWIQPETAEMDIVTWTTHYYEDVLHWEGV